MEYDRDYSFSNMYFATEVRFDALGRLVKNVTSFFNRSTPTSSRATATARA